MLAKAEIEEFKQVYQDTYGVELDTETATAIAHRVIGLYDATLKEYKAEEDVSKRN